MKKLCKDKAVWILAAGGMLLCWLFVIQYGVFGSKVDWISQHTVFADYFRQRFYETGSLFPDIAWNLGGGQNIYNIAYYGLFNPVILFSYLLPFVKMDAFIMGSSIFSFCISAVIFYQWLKGKDMPKSICFGTACMFEMAAPLLYHSYNQLMFVNYMPFLCLGFIGADRYFIKKERKILVLSVTGMIFTSFYFSIGGMAALCIYASGEYLIYDFPLKAEVKGRFWKAGFGFAGNLILSVLLCGVLLLPAAASLLAGRQRGGSRAGNTARGLLRFVLKRVLYSPYGIGLTSLALIALVAGVVCAKTWREMVIPLLLLVILNVPAFGYLLNGGLYEKDKVFIPFLPLVCLQTAKYMNSSTHGTSAKQKIRELLPYAIVFFLIWTERDASTVKQYWMLILAECCAMYVLYLVHQRFPGSAWPLLASCVILFFYGWECNKSRDYMLSEERYEAVQAEKKSIYLEQIFEEDASLYRIDQLGTGQENHDNINRILDIRQNITSLYSSSYNTAYREFRNHTFGLNEPLRNDMMQAATDNPCFLTFMGVKYILAKNPVQGYSKIEGTDSWAIYCNPLAAPVLYATNQVIGESEYFDLSFPDNQTSLLQRAVVPDTYLARTELTSGSDSAAPDVKNNRIKEKASIQKSRVRQAKLSVMKPCEFVLPQTEEENIKIQKTENGYELWVKKETEIMAELTKAASADNLLAVDFSVENLRPRKDMYIQIEEQTNRLTSVSSEYANHNTNFTYMVTLKHSKARVSIKLGQGKYRIRDVRAYTGNMDELKSTALYQSWPELGQKAVQGDTITEKIDVKEDGFLITSIPFDENFTVLIDGKEADIFKVNTAFLGAGITQGQHEVTILYQAPGKRLGMVISLTGILILLLQQVVKLKASSCEKMPLFICGHR